MIYHINTNQKDDSETILIQEMETLRQETLPGDKEEHLIMKRVSIDQEDINIPNLYSLTRKLQNK